MDKEGLASVYGVAKFYQYLIDCKFIIKSDKLASPTHFWWIKAHNIIYQQWHLLTCNIRNWHSTHTTTPSRHVCPHRLPQLIYSPITVLHSLTVSSRKSSRRMEFTIWHIAVGLAWIAGSITAVCGKRSFAVELSDDRVMKQQIDISGAGQFLIHRMFPMGMGIIWWHPVAHALFQHQLSQDGSSPSLVATPQQSTCQRGSPAWTLHSLTWHVSSYIERNVVNLLWH